jgi:ATP-dependent DNA helicase RecG
MMSHKMKYLGSESSVLEFKQELPKNDQIVKTVVGFCNQNGGKLLIGVANSGDIVGIPEEQAAHALEFLGQHIYQSISPSVLPRLYTQSFGDKIALVIEVSPGTNKPYYRIAEDIHQGTYVRLGSTTLRATPDIIEELRWEAKGKSYDEMPVYRTSQEDLDFPKVDHFLTLRKDRKVEKITTELLRSYYLIATEQGNTYASISGLLLFGKNPQQHPLSEAFIICSHFRGIEGRDAIASVDCVGTLFEQFQTAFHFIVSRLSKSFSIRGPRREEELEVPQEAIREVLLNAIVHRNYHIKGSIKIAIYDNRIEIFSPGTFPGPLDLQQLTSGISYMRNLAICKVFREAQYIEKLGSGLIVLFHSYEKRKLKSPEVIEGVNYVKCILPRQKLLSEQTDQYGTILTLFETVSNITISDVIQTQGVSRATAKRWLQALVKKGKIIQVGRGRAVTYCLVT